MDRPITCNSCFIYELSIYKITSDMVSCILCKYYTSDIFLEVKDTEVIEVHRNYKLIQYITLLEAPKQFIENYEKTTC